MKVAVYSLIGCGQGPTCDVPNILLFLEEDINNADIGDVIIVTAGEMTQEELDALPEWDGF